MLDALHPPLPHFSSFVLVLQFRLDSAQLISWGHGLSNLPDEREARMKGGGICDGAQEEGMGLNQLDRDRKGRSLGKERWQNLMCWG